MGSSVLKEMTSKECFSHISWHQALVLCSRLSITQENVVPSKDDACLKVE